MKFERTVEFTPAYDKRHKDPKKNYGVGSAQIRFLLKGKEGVVQLLLGTKWYLEEKSQDEATAISRKFRTGKYSGNPYTFLDGWDLGYHSPKPMYDGHTPLTKKCSYLDGKKCYYDGSSLNASRFVPILVEKGSEEVWKELEKYYKGVFKKGTTGGFGEILQALIGRAKKK